MASIVAQQLAAGYVIGKEGPLVHLSATLSVRQPAPKRPPPRLRTAPQSTSLGRPKAQDAPTHARAQPAQLGGSPGPPQLALAGPKSIEMVRMLLRCSS